MKIIYIYCPAHSCSGGPEALHQLAHYLGEEGYRPLMVYYGILEEKTKKPIQYNQYNTPSCPPSQVKDSEENLLLLPEVATPFMDSFKKIQKGVWWLSVDNYKASIKRHTLPGRIKYTAASLLKGMPKNRMPLGLLGKKIDIQNPMISHFTGSYYAENYLKQRSIESRPLIEPLGKDFLRIIKKYQPDSRSKKDQILYNPVKDQKYLPRLMKKYPGLKAVPLRNFASRELIALMKESKLYVDFGPFPGPERLPKEAVALGCSIITSRRGASAFYGDVPIPDRFKIDDLSDLKAARERIAAALENYSSDFSQFEAYRTMVGNLERNFIGQIHKNFKDFRP